jgi:hypothetical protein
LGESHITCEKEDQELIILRFFYAIAEPMSVRMEEEPTVLRRIPEKPSHLMKLSASHTILP